MASIRKRGQSWQARARRQGRAPITKTFLKRADAELWAEQTEVCPGPGKRRDVDACHGFQWADCLSGELSRPSCIRRRSR